MTTKFLLQDYIPPIIWRGLLKIQKKIRGYLSASNNFEYGVEQPPEFYDATFNESKHWKQHYTKSHYYPLWTVIADRIRHLNIRSILDIGCGPGQIACLVRDLGVEKYVGLDFSPARITRARSVCPEYKFIATDIFECDILEKSNYDCVLIMEFLEHIEKDIELIRKIPAGTQIIATVPNFPAAGHVRHFHSIEDVKSRYELFFNSLEIVDILAEESGTTYYLMQGVIA